MSLEQIILLLTTYKYFFLFPIVVIEGPIITVIAGFLSSLGHLNPFISYAVVVTGDLVGDTLWYLLGFHGGVRFIERWGRYIKVQPDHLEKVRTFFNTHPERTLFWGKLAYGVEIPLLVSSGIAKVPFKIFILYTLLPTLPKSLLFLLIGFYFGKSYSQIHTFISVTSVATIGIALTLIVIYIILRKIGNRYKPTP